MRISSIALCGLTAAFAFLPIGADAASLQEAAAALGAADAKSLEFSGAGHWYQFGQAPAPGGAWPQFELKSYSASVNFDVPAARVLLTRIQTTIGNTVTPPAAAARRKGSLPIKPSMPACILRKCGTGGSG